MHTAQIRLQEVAGIYRRRWKLLVFPTIIVTALCTIGAFMLPRKYEATATILVQPDETLAQLQDYQIQGAFDEQLRSYGEIMSSRPFISAVIDSLGLSAPGQGVAEREQLIADVKRMIITDRRNPGSFSITFINSDPSRTKRGAEVVTNLFIQTQLSVKNRQNALTVQFLERKVEELRQGFENTTRSLVSEMRQNLDELPAETRSLYDSVNELERKSNANEARIKSYQKSIASIQTILDVLRTNPDALRSEDGKKPLLGLLREDLPYVAEARAVVDKYDEATQRYTGKYPEIEKYEKQIVTLLDRMRVAAEDERAKHVILRTELDQNRSVVMESLKKLSVSSRINEDKESNYQMDLKQYNEMKTRLEQARLKAEVESKGADQYLVLDPAVYPTKPTKPNRRLLVMGGFGLAVFLGVVSVIIAELLDTTVRTSRDIEVYDKPIIALLPDGARDYR